MNKLIVFIGKPGVGKTTLIESSFSRLKRVDVLPFVKKYEKDGVLAEEKTILAYQEMYVSLQEELEVSKGDMILELGTNHSEFNIEQLNNLSEKFSLFIFLCVAPLDVCRERAIERGRYFQKDALEKRLLRDFPRSHRGLLESKSFKCTELNTNRELKKVILEIESVINSE